MLPWKQPDSSAQLSFSVLLIVINGNGGVLQASRSGAAVQTSVPPPQAAALVSHVCVLKRLISESQIVPQTSGPPAGTCCSSHLRQTSPVSSGVCVCVCLRQRSVGLWGGSKSGGMELMVGWRNVQRSSLGRIKGQRLNSDH